MIEQVEKIIGHTAVHLRETPWRQEVMRSDEQAARWIHLAAGLHTGPVKLQEPERLAEASGVTAGLQAVGGVGDLAIVQSAAIVDAPACEGALGVQGAAVFPTRAHRGEGA